MSAPLIFLSQGDDKLKKMTEQICAKCGKCHTEQKMELRIHGKKLSDTSLYCPNCDDLIEPSICKKTTDKKGCKKYTTPKQPNGSVNGSVGSDKNHTQKGVEK